MLYYQVLLVYIIIFDCFLNSVHLKSRRHQHSVMCHVSDFKMY